MVYFVQRLASLSVQCTQLIWMIFCKIQQHFVPKHLQCLFSATTQNKMFFLLKYVFYCICRFAAISIQDDIATSNIFFFIRFWYLRCCGCPWNRGRQHLATPLKTCHETEAGFLTSYAYPPTQTWRHLRLRRSRTWAVCLPLSPQKGDHPPSHDDNFARTSVCRWLLQKPTASQVEAARDPEKGGLYSDLPTPRWTCLKKLSGLHLPRFEIRVFPLLWSRKDVVEKVWSRKSNEQFDEMWKELKSSERKDSKLLKKCTQAKILGCIEILHRWYNTGWGSW